MQQRFLYMEKESKDQTDFFLQWGNRKRTRCVKVKDDKILEKSSSKKITSRVNRCVVRVEKEAPSPLVNRISNSTTVPSIRNDYQKSQSSSPDKEDRYYSTRGSSFLEEGGKVSMEMGDEKGLVLPRFFISLSSKEKEEDFMAMKGCKLPQRPKKRAKFIQRSLHLVSPGAWLSDLSQERYEVREKKSSKKRARGLKAMRSVESDSD